MTGEGIFAEQIALLFKVGSLRAGIGSWPTLSSNHSADRQLSCASLIEHRLAKTKRRCLAVRRRTRWLCRQFAFGLTVSLATSGIDHV
jgi:hypothetical protein